MTRWGSYAFVSGGSSKAAFTSSRVNPGSRNPRSRASLLWMSRGRGTGRYTSSPNNPGRNLPSEPV
jgi:hypothetical protein